ncbi:MAG TPA: hypothetical protein VN687_06390 [Blastocatellia bacterium]|nr:hypothetical protein [Blastocatellia bacterium]
MPLKLDRLAADGISPAPRFAIHYFESAEAYYVNAVTGLKMALDDFK